MGSPSKEERVLELFLNEPTKHWHFHDIVKTAGVSEAAAHKWLKKLVKEGIIAHVEFLGKMPYFQSRWNSSEYQIRKKSFAIRKLEESGVLQELMSMENAKTVVIFGSWYRGDWNTHSDVDVFILGDAGHLSAGTYLNNLGFQGKPREISVHSYPSHREI